MKSSVVWYAGQPDNGCSEEVLSHFDGKSMYGCVNAADDMNNDVVKWVDRSVLFE